MFTRLNRLKIELLRTFDRDFIVAGLSNKEAKARARLFMSVVISSLLLLAGLYVLLFRVNSDNYLREVASGWIGMVIMYWID